MAYLLQEQQIKLLALTLLKRGLYKSNSKFFITSGLLGSTLLEKGLTIFPSFEIRYLVKFQTGSEPDSSIICL